MVKLLKVIDSYNGQTPIYVNIDQIAYIELKGTAALIYLINRRELYVKREEVEDFLKNNS